jgi:hypothetical protein
MASGAQSTYHLTMMSEPTLSLNCFLLGTNSSGVFTVKIPKTKNVGILKALIKEKQSPRLNRVVASDLTVWKVSLSDDAITPELTVDDVERRQKLRSVKNIASAFSEALVDEHVHILVQAPPGTFHTCFLNLTFHSFLFPKTLPISCRARDVDSYRSESFMTSATSVQVCLMDLIFLDSTNELVSTVPPFPFRLWS